MESGEKKNSTPGCSLASCALSTAQVDLLNRLREQLVSELVEEEDKKALAILEGRSEGL